MNDLFEIIKFILPALIVFLTCYYIVKSFFDNEEKRRLIEIKKAGQKISTPIRFQAYERLALFLERINPENMLVRVHKSGMTARMLQLELLNTIRHEFNHNLSQQVYVSDMAWNKIKNAKEETIKIIHIATTKVKDDALGIDLSKEIFTILSQLEKLPTQIALDFLKNEIRKSF